MHVRDANVSGTVRRDASKSRVMLSTTTPCSGTRPWRCSSNSEADIEVFTEVSDGEEALSIVKRERNIISMTY